MSIVARSNDALRNNPPFGAEAHITTHGSDFLWAVFATFLFVDCCLFIWCLFRPPGTRLMNQLAILVLTIGAWDYFAQASNLGWTTTRTAFDHYTDKGITRQVWWCRYVDWILTGPLLLVMISFLSGCHWREMISVAFTGAVIWTGWLIGSLITSQYRWAYYVFGVVMGMFGLWYTLFAPVRKAAARLAGRYYTINLVSSIFYAFMMMMYAIAWGCCEGGNTVSSTSEVVWYGVLDLVIKPFGLIAFLFFTKDTDYHLLRQSRYEHEIGDRGVDALNNHHTGQYTAHHAGVSPAAAITTTRSGNTVDNEKAAYGKKNGRWFGRKGAHDDPNQPTTVPPVQVASPEVGPGRTSVGTMVEPENTFIGPVGHERDRPIVYDRSDRPPGERIVAERTVLTDPRTGEPRVVDRTVVGESRHGNVERTFIGETRIGNEPRL